MANIVSFTQGIAESSAEDPTGVLEGDGYFHRDFNRRAQIRSLVRLLESVREDIFRLRVILLRELEDLN
jgi:hypothetical protein